MEGKKSMTDKKEFSLNIAGYSYKVESLPLRELPETMIRDAVGYHSFQHLTIQVSQEYCPIRQVEIFNHEILHAINDITDLDMTEHQITSLSYLLSPLLLQEDYINVRDQLLNGK